MKDNTHCYLHAQLGLRVHFGERHLRKQQKKYGSNIWNECRQNSFAFGLVRRPAPHTLTFGLGCDVASYLKQGSKGKALQQKESSAWVWRGQRGGDKATQDSGRNPKSHTGTDQSRRARNCTHCLNQGSPTPPKDCSPTQRSVLKIAQLFELQLKIKFYSVAFLLQSHLKLYRFENDNLKNKMIKNILLHMKPREV